MLAQLEPTPILKVTEAMANRLRWKYRTQRWKEEELPLSIIWDMLLGFHRW